MDKIFGLGGKIIGLLGVLLTVVSGVTRVSGHFYLGGFEAMSLFMGGMGLMLIGSLAQLHLLTSQRH